MLGARVEKRKAEDLKKFLKKNGKLNSNYGVFGSNLFIYFPLNGELEDKIEKAARRLGAKIVDKKFKRLKGGIRNRKTIRDAAHGYDLYGNIAVIDAAPRAAKKMAKLLMKSNKNIKTVLRKGGAVSGRYRTRKFIFVSGERNYIATYRENGCLFRFDVRKVFFSARLAYERKRISDLVRDGEHVMVLFAGVGPYAIEIAKSHKKSKVIAIELNGSACKNMRDNITLNKVKNVVCEEGDVNKFGDKYKGFADRIVMPLPKDSSSFLPIALKMSKKGCVIHYYHFCRADKVEDTADSVKLFFRKRGVGATLINQRVVRPYSSKEIEIVLDMRVR
ncbi:MAG: class I SAM-dependent methyltransferase family protein [Candidatus Micrarchaeales archaeon]|jgi:tRNA (guanine37-N1)-methyltransferase